MANSKTTNSRLLELENALKTKLQRVVPDQQFVGHLRKRLEDSLIYQKKRRLAEIFLTIAAGLTIGFVVFLIGVGFLHEVKKA